MSDEARVLLDMATLAEIDGEPVRARKLRESATFMEGLEVQIMTLERRVVSLEDRLEVYSAPDARGKRIYLDIGDCDGIGCRDETIKLLDKRIESLEEGECRFHCRMRKDMWKSGFRWCMKHFNWADGIDVDNQYTKWRTQHD